MVLFGIICGILTNIDAGPINAGEFIYIIGGISIVFYRARVYFNNSLLKYVCCMAIFFVYNIIYYFVDILSTDTLLRAMIKYGFIFIIAVITYQFLAHDRDSFLKFLFFFSSAQLLASYVMHYLGSATLVRFLHYNNFIFPVIMLLQFPFFKKHYKIVLIIAMGLAMYGNSRTAELIVAAVFLWMFISEYKHKLSGRYGIFIKGFLMMLLVASLVVGVSTLSNNIDEETKSNNERKELLQVGFNIVSDNFLIGVGPGNMIRYSNKNLNTNLPLDTSTHNYYLDVFSEYGLIGFLLIVIPFIGPLINLFDFDDKNYVLKCAYLFLMVTIPINVVASSFRVTFAIVLACGFYTVADKYDVISVSKVKKIKTT